MISRYLGLFLAPIFLLVFSSASAEHAVAPGEVDADISEYTGQAGEGPFPPFSELDRDGDGQLSREEVAGIEPLHRQFEAADVGQDGSLDQSEFSAFETRIGVMPGVDTDEGQTQQ